MAGQSDWRAWNNFVQHSSPTGPWPDRATRAAAIANMFMGGANNGGLNSFLTTSHELCAQEVFEALLEIGASEAARQLGQVLAGLGQPLPAAPSELRWEVLDRLWTDDLDDLDTLSSQADAELMAVLERHVSEYRTYYTGLDA